MGRQALNREDWVRTAYRTLETKGVEAVLVEPLCRQLRVSKGSFYWHFRDRRELLGEPPRRRPRGGARPLPVAPAGGRCGAVAAQQRRGAARARRLAGAGAPAPLRAAPAQARGPARGAGAAVRGGAGRVPRHGT